MTGIQTLGAVLIKIRFAGINFVSFKKNPPLRQQFVVTFHWKASSEFPIVILIAKNAVNPRSSILPKGNGHSQGFGRGTGR